MPKLKCLIVEDEPLAAEIIQSYIDQVSFLKLEGICTDAIAAFEILKQKSIDLIFLDIHLPKLKGFDFIKALHHPPKIIITSAYKEYALEGYEFEIADYLLKPISFERFLKAINRLDSEIDQSQAVLTDANRRDARYFNVNKRLIRVYLDEILYVESLKDYVKIYTKHKCLTTKFQLGEIEKFLDNENFLRVHRSYFVAMDKIESISSTEVELAGKLIPIGRSYWGLIKERLKI